MQKRKQPLAEIFRRYHIKVKPVEISRLDDSIFTAQHLCAEFLMDDGWSAGMRNHEVLRVLRIKRHLDVAKKDIEKYKTEILKQIERGKK